MHVQAREELAAQDDAALRSAPPYATFALPRPVHALQRITGVRWETLVAVLVKKLSCPRRASRPRRRVRHFAIGALNSRHCVIYDPHLPHCLFWIEESALATLDQRALNLFVCYNWDAARKRDGSTPQSSAEAMSSAKVGSKSALLSAARSGGGSAADGVGGGGSASSAGRAKALWRDANTKMSGEELEVMNEICNIILFVAFNTLCRQ